MPIPDVDAESIDDTDSASTSGIGMSSKRVSEHTLGLYREFSSFEDDDDDDDDDTGDTPTKSRMRIFISVRPGCRTAYHVLFTRAYMASGVVTGGRAGSGTIAPARKCIGAGIAADSDGDTAAIFSGRLTHFPILYYGCFFIND